MQTLAHVGVAGLHAPQYTARRSPQESKVDTFPQVVGPVRVQRTESGSPAQASRGLVEGEVLSEADSVELALVPLQADRRSKDSRRVVLMDNLECWLRDAVFASRAAKSARSSSPGPVA